MRRADWLRAGAPAALLVAALASCGTRGPMALDGGDGTDAPGPAAAGACSRDHWCWDNPRPQGNELRAAWAAGADDVWTAGAGGTVLRWNSASPSQIAFDSDATLESLSGAAPNDVWAVVSQARPADALRHWDGSAWTVVRPSAAPSGFQPFAVFATSARDVWVTGVYGSGGMQLGAVLRWDGGAWASLATDAVVPNRFWASGPDDAWAVPFSGSTALHWTGGEWRRVELPLPEPAAQVTSVSGTARDDVWMAGNRGLMIHWDGSAWSPRARPTGTEDHAAVVWSAGVDDVWLASEVPGDAQWLAQSLLAHWDGRAWSTAATFRERVAAITGARGGDAWVVGEHGLVLRARREGVQRLAPAPVAADVREDVVALRGSGAGDLWALSAENATGAPSSIWHRDGRRWTRAFTSATTLTALWVASASDAWAVGAGGTVLHYDGVAWSTRESGTTLALVDVWGSGADDVWIASAASALLHWDGHALSTVDPVTTLPATFASVRWVRLGGAGARDVWAVGHAPYPCEEIRIAHWDGAMWSPSEIQTFCPWRHTGPIGLWESAPSDIWISGPETWHWNGAQWTAADASAPTNADLWGSGANDVWAAGAQGAISHWDGVTWARVRSGAATSLAAVWGADARNVSAAGAGATVLRYTP